MLTDIIQSSLQSAMLKTLGESTQTVYWGMGGDIPSINPSILNSDTFKIVGAGIGILGVYLIGKSLISKTNQFLEKNFPINLSGSEYEKFSK